MIAWVGDFGDRTTTDTTYVFTPCYDYSETYEPLPVCYNPKPPDPLRRKPEKGYARKLIRRTEKTQGKVHAASAHKGGGQA